MAQTIREVMTENPTVLDADASVADAARIMRDEDQGDVLISRDGQLCGIVTDRDIVVRGVAETVDLATVRVGDLATRELVTVSPDDKVKEAVKLMRQEAVRRLPVMEDGKAV